VFSYDFFLAHAGPDAAGAERLYDLLGAETRVFLDSRSLVLKDDRDRALSEAQRSSRVTVVLVSANTDTAFYLREEISAAIDLARANATEHRVVPVYLDAVPASVPYGLRLKHGLMVSDHSSFEQVAARLLDLHRTLVARMPEPAAAHVADRDEAAAGVSEGDVVRNMMQSGTSLQGSLPPTIASPHSGRGVSGQKAKLFISYSHRDERYLEQLVTHLAGLRRQGVIADWHDRKIVPGQEWRDAIDQNLDAADCALLLISADFLASDYCYSIEMQRTLSKHREGRVLVIPVIVRPADWQHTPLGGLQALPKDAKPVVEWTPRDRAWLSVTDGLRDALAPIRRRLATPNDQLEPSVEADLEPRPEAKRDTPGEPIGQPIGRKTGRPEALRVSAWAEPRTEEGRWLVAHNGSDEPVYSCTLWLISPRMPPRAPGGLPPTGWHSAFTSLIRPQHDYRYLVPADRLQGSGLRRLPRVEIIFRDSRSQWWWRKEDSAIQQLTSEQGKNYLR